MLGSKSKISKHEINIDFDKLINDADHGRLKVDKIRDFERPAYYGTSLCQSQGSSQYDGRMLYAESTKGSD